MATAPQHSIGWNSCNLLSVPQIIRNPDLVVAYINSAQSGVEQLNKLILLTTRSPRPKLTDHYMTEAC